MYSCLAFFNTAHPVGKNLPVDEFYSAVGRNPAYAVSDRLINSPRHHHDVYIPPLSCGVPPPHVWSTYTFTFHLPQDEDLSVKQKARQAIEKVMNDIELGPSANTED